jgi:putative transposase
MAWKERSRVDERMLLIGEYLKGERAMTDLCREFSVSRKTAYKWVTRYNEDGPAGLADKSRARCRIPLASMLSSSRRCWRHDGPIHTGAPARSWAGSVERSRLSRGLRRAL